MEIVSLNCQEGTQGRTEIMTLTRVLQDLAGLPRLRLDGMELRLVVCMDDTDVALGHYPQSLRSSSRLLSGE